MSVTSLDGIPQRPKQFIFSYAQSSQGSHSAFGFDLCLDLSRTGLHSLFLSHASDFCRVQGDFLLDVTHSRFVWLLPHWFCLTCSSIPCISCNLDVWFKSLTRLSSNIYGKKISQVMIHILHNIISGGI